MRTLLLLVPLAACAPADDAVGDTDTLEDRTVSPDRAETTYALHNEAFVVPPGEEVQRCDVLWLRAKGDEKLVWANGFQGFNAAGSHHVNALIGAFSAADLIAPGTAETLLGHPAGSYDCDEIGDLMAAGAQTIYASQTDASGGTFPDGVAIPIPLPLLVVMQHHFINTTERPIRVDAEIQFLTEPEDQVDTLATGFFTAIPDVDLPPRSSKIETTTCQVSRDIDLFLATGHMHERGDCFTIHRYDGRTDAVADTPFFVNKDWTSSPQLFFEHDPAWGAPMHLAEGDGFHFACHYRNTEDREITTGETAQDEMCIAVGVGYPSEFTKADVAEMLAHPSLDMASTILTKGLIQCTPKEGVASPWAHADEAMPLDTPSACADLPWTGVDD